jgi:hypothetical protein
VLDFSRGRLGGGIKLTLSAQPLEPTLQQVVDLQSAHSESIIKVTFALTKPVMADPMRIGQFIAVPRIRIGGAKWVRRRCRRLSLRMSRHYFRDCSLPSRGARCGPASRV